MVGKLVVDRPHSVGMAGSGYVGVGGLELCAEL